MSHQCLDSPTDPVFFLTREHVEEGIAASRINKRRRIMLPIQRSEAAPVQRLLNIMQPGSYVQPHRHPRPQAIELAHVLQGAMRVWIFDDTGNVLQTRCCTAGSTESLVDLEPDIWHSFAALEPDTVILEIKGGPYDKSRDKIFAPWAPVETESEATAYLKALLEKS
ncbi:MAG: WbuC family cupin fold metalloprotein [Verrucomicrobiota bacterium]